MGSTISSLVFQPPPPTYKLASSRYISLITSTNCRIAAFFINRGYQYTILFSHGNAEDLGMIYDYFLDLSRELQVNVLAYDYPGYGASQGECSEVGCYAAIEAAFTYLTQIYHIQSKYVLLYGRSLGSGPSCYLAAKQAQLGNPLAGVILQSPLLSIYRVAFHFRFTILGDFFCNIDRIHHITCPITIIHGTRDEVVPFWHGEELFACCQQQWRYQPLWVDGAGHNNLELRLSESGGFVDHLHLFVQTCHATNKESENVVFSDAVAL